MSKSAGGKSRKHGRNKPSCALYRSTGREDRNKRRNIAREFERVAWFAERNAIIAAMWGVGKSEARRMLRRGITW